jgi:hypothetical protein
MTVSLSTAVFPAKIARLVPLLGSNRDGEIIATVHAIGRSLKSAGRDWHDLAAAIETNTTSRLSAAAAHRDWRGDLKFCAQTFDRLNERERDFVASLVSSTAWREPTEKQLKWLGDIAARLRSSAA